MKKNILFRTNIFVCVIIVLGFIITSLISYNSNIGIFEEEVEHVSDLAAESIYYKIDSIFTKPISVSLTMANDSLLKDFLDEEEVRLNDDDFLQSMRDYLYAYREKYSYDSIFLVSTQTNRYYHFNGVDRVLADGNAEDVWFFDFLNGTEEYSLNIDNDEAADNEITVFINCKINDGDGRTMGVVGVGFRVNYLQALLQQYEDDFGVRARLVDGTGRVEVSTQHTGYENVNLFDNGNYGELKDTLLTADEEAHTFWSTSSADKGYIVSRYIDNMNWHLIVENDTTAQMDEMNITLVKGIFVILLIIIVVLLTITTVMRKYNAQIIELTAKQEREYYAVRQEAAKQIYENIYEFDITHNCAVGENTEHYFESLEIPARAPYDEAIKIIAAKQIKKEFRQGYLNMFSPEHILESYENGTKSLIYDFMFTSSGENYYWMRIMACIYFWSEDQSVRMTTYRQNIDAEKMQEKMLLAQMRSDPLTGLYNKAATEELIKEKLFAAEPGSQYAFFMLDIDDFKNINDTLGHAAGDFVIARFAENLQKLFDSDDIVGRIGGDEFAVLSPVLSDKELEEKSAALVSRLNEAIQTEAGRCSISISLGISVYPRMGTDFNTLYKKADSALYRTKNSGKNGYTIYRENLNR